MLQIPDKALLSDQIRLALTDEIATGRLRPGAALDEQQIADRFGASRTPVREALRQLAMTGMVELRARRGVIVAPMMADRVSEMFETMAEIEAMCVRLATSRITPLERSRLLTMHESSAAYVRDGDIDRYDQFNNEFHAGIYAATHNEFMAEQALTIRARMSGFRRMQLRQGNRMIRSRAEHDDIVRAMAGGDGDAAARNMRAHMLNACGALATYLEQLSAE
jgi:DNA-binding GntR family transcriptional regulator